MYIINKIFKILKKFKLKLKYIIVPTINLPGIEPNCEKYRLAGQTFNYSYLIDPDGPSGE